MNLTILQRWLVLAYGVGCYLIFVGVFLYAIGFIGNFLVPTTLDAPASGPLGTAALINLGLLGIFAVQHSGMARPGFKRWLTRLIPQPLERSTYVLFSNAALILIFAFWQPMGLPIWTIEAAWGQGLMYTIFGLGWVTVFVSTCLIDHFDLFGLRQTWLYFRGRPYTPPTFACPGPYRVVRHPLYVGWLMTFWATPTMTVAHLIFAIACTGYILIAIQLEERDLVDYHGNAYRDYQLRVPMLIPRIRRRPLRSPKLDM